MPVGEGAYATLHCPGFEWGLAAVQVALNRIMHPTCSVLVVGLHADA